MMNHEPDDSLKSNLNILDGTSSKSFAWEKLDWPPKT